MKVITQYPIAFDSPDHLHPMGTKHDNSTCKELLDELQQRFGTTYKLLDLGCAGGQFVIDCVNRGNVAIGLEGSDYSVHHARANWPEHHDKELLLCDISRPFAITTDLGSHVHFDVITSWEVFEHIPPERLDCFFDNIAKHLSSDGIVFASISRAPHVHEGANLHQSAHLSWQEWQQRLGRLFDIAMYPYPWSPRDDTRATSYFVQLTHANKGSK
jgi:cyclopropane fatty-acyl-phospholipid synthase-like methyltransferase